MLAGSFFRTGLGLGFFEEDLDSDLDLRTVDLDLDLDLDLTVAGLVTSLICSTKDIATFQTYAIRAQCRPPITPPTRYIFIRQVSLRAQQSHIFG